MKTTSARAIAAVIIANLGVFLGVVALPSFQAAHHHWIFPVLAVLFAAQWALTFIPTPADGFVDRAALRGSIVSLLVFLLVVGIARHATILACFDRCSFKLAAAAAIAGCVFLGQVWADDEGFWNPLRASLALSDQLNFWAQGFPAVMLSDTAFYRNANYHEATDLPETLDYEKMAEVANALAAVVAEAP